MAHEENLFVDKSVYIRTCILSLAMHIRLFLFPGAENQDKVCILDMHLIDSMQTH